MGMFMYRQLNIRLHITGSSEDVYSYSGGQGIPRLSGSVFESRVLREIFGTKREDTKM
jgi:hypothetical protein